jgi:hypothetical protein
LVEYKVIFFLKPAVRLPSEINVIDLTFEESKGKKRLIISRIEDIVSGVKIDSGLRFTVLLEAGSLKEGIEEAKSFVDGIVSFITLDTGVGLEIPSEQIAYDVSPDIAERDFMQVYRDPLGIVMSRRTLNEKTFDLLLDKALKLEPKENGSIARASRWYRLGTMTPDVFDRFNCFWIGLEALNPVLQERFAIKDDEISCPKCRYRWSPTPTISGIRTFVQNKIDSGKSLYSRFRDLRINVMHAKKSLYELDKEALELTPKIAEVLFRAICFLLKIEEWNQLPYRSILRPGSVRIELETTLIGGKPSSLGQEGKEPFFEQKHEIKKIDPPADFTIRSNFTARINPEIKWRKKEVRFYGDPEMRGSIVDSEVKGKDEQ